MAVGRYPVVHRFRLLGRLEVWDGDSWQAIGAPKWRAVLAVLLVNAGQVVSVDALIDAVWGDDCPANAANLISIYVLRLRRLIGDPEVVVTRAPGYLLRLAPGDLDSQCFEELVAEGRRELDPERAAALLREALGLWRGDALADVPPSSAIEVEAQRLVELRLAATELRIEADLACERYAQVVPELRAMLVGSQLRERLWLLLIRALDGDGRRAEALEAYAQAREAIADQLGVDPGAELQRTYEMLLAADDLDARLAYEGKALQRVRRHDKTAAGTAPTSPRHDELARALRIVPAEEPSTRTTPPEQPLPATDTPGPASREGFGHMLTAVMKRGRLTDVQAASIAGITVATAASWCAGTQLPPLTTDGLAALRAILAACGITATDQVLAWTDALIHASADHGADHQDPGAGPGRLGRISPPVPDAPGYDLCPDPLQAQTPAEFVQALAGFHVWAGKPPLRNIEKACGHEVSIATMSTALRGSKLPPLRTVLAIVRGCGGTPAHQERFTTAWRKLQPPFGGRGLYPVPDTA